MSSGRCMGRHTGSKSGCWSDHGNSAYASCIVSCLANLAIQCTSFNQHKLRLNSTKKPWRPTECRLAEAKGTGTDGESIRRAGSGRVRASHTYKWRRQPLWQMRRSLGPKKTRPRRSILEMCGQSKARLLIRCWAPNQNAPSAPRGGFRPALALCECRFGENAANNCTQQAVAGGAPKYSAANSD